MGQLIHAGDLRLLQFGQQIRRNAAVLPASGTGHIFTVSGGLVVVTALVGQVTTACSATATTLKITATPSTGTAVDLTSAVAVTSAEAGSLITLPTTLGGALSVTTSGAGQIPGLQFLVAPGTIDITTSATNTGQVAWSLTYAPWDNGGQVYAA